MNRSLSVRTAALCALESRRAFGRGVRPGRNLIALLERAGGAEGLLDAKDEDLILLCQEMRAAMRALAGIEDEDIQTRR